MGDGADHGPVELFAVALEAAQHEPNLSEKNRVASHELPSEGSIPCFVGHDIPMPLKTPSAQQGFFHHLSSDQLMFAEPLAPLNRANHERDGSFVSNEAKRRTFPSWELDQG
ncbi:hypothetical protein Q1695_012830 [Nippostrongylus brasiliensis]|nr:hypothetical protein Q1695_012830 [Nippostrongylus brasiliensis]